MIKMIKKNVKKAESESKTVNRIVLPWACLTLRISPELALFPLDPQETPVPEPV